MKLPLTGGKEAYLKSEVGVAVQANVPALLMGSPGVGKTAYLNTLGQYLDSPVEVVTLNNREPPDILGQQIFADFEHGLILAPPPWAQRLNKAGKGILFFDEYTTAPPALQAASLRVIQERMVGDLRLPDDVAIVLAANPIDEAANGYDLTAPAANRLYHISCELDPIAWVQNTLAGWPDSPMPVRPFCQPFITQARAAIASFIQVRPTALLNVPKDLTRAGEAWQSPRCYDDQTEVLTGGGWKYWSDVKDDETFAAISPDGTMTYKKAKKVIRSAYHGPMIRIKAQHVDLLVTPNHSLYVAKDCSGSSGGGRKRLNDSFELTETREVIKDIGSHSSFRIRMRKDAKWAGSKAKVKKIGNRRVSYGDWCEFLGWWLTDGCLIRRSKTIQITQVDKGNREHIAELFRLLGCPRIVVKQDRVHGFDRDLYELLKPLGWKHAGTRRVPRDVLRQRPEHLKRLLDGAFGGDGWPSNGAHYICVGRCKELADDLQEAAIKAGQTAHVFYRIDNYKKPLWIVSLMTLRYARPVLQKKDFTEETYNGVVYCADVPPSHTLMVRRNGHVVWCGNSWSNAIMLLAAHMAVHGETVNIERDLPVIAGCVGHGAALEYLEYREKLDLPNPEDVLANPKTFPLNLRSDMIEALLSGITAATIANLTPARYAAAWVVYGRVVKEANATDIAAVHAFTMAQHLKRGVFEIPSEVSLFVKILRAVDKM